MATGNPFDILGNDDNDDPSQLIASQNLKVSAKKPINAVAEAPAAAVVKLPSKPPPPAQAVREARSGGVPGRTGRGGPAGGSGARGGRNGPNREFGNGNTNGFAGGNGGGEDGDAVKPFEREKNYDGGRGSYGGRRQSSRGGRRGGYGNGEAGGDSEHPPRRIYERKSGTGRGHEMKREGAGRGNWGTATDGGVEHETEANVNIEENVVTEKQPEQEDATSKESKDVVANDAAEKEDKEMTLDEYEKIREEKRKALLTMKTELRKVDFDKEFEQMERLSIKKGNEDIFIKLGTDKDASKRKENAGQEEQGRKMVSINEFLKPAEGERYYNPGGLSHGRGRGDRGSSRGSFGGAVASTPAAPSIEDPSQFPTLGLN